MSAKILAPDLGQLHLVETKVTTATETTSYLGYYRCTADAHIRHNREGARVVTRVIAAPTDRRDEIQPYYERKLARRAEIFDPDEIVEAFKIAWPIGLILLLAAVAGSVTQ